jgi:hypothetical protein
MKNFKDIHIGEMIFDLINERNIEISRVCHFLHCSESALKQMFTSKSLDTDHLLRFSKLLKYDFFRIYSQHLILYAPQNGESNVKNVKFKTAQFRKNIYTKEIIDFILELIDNQEKSIKQIVEDYGIPKSTVHRWNNKYKK